MWKRSERMIMHGLSEVAGQNAYSVLGLRAIGENAEGVIYCEHPFGYPYDRNLHIDKTNKKKYPIYIMKLFLFFITALHKYSVFHFHYGHSVLNCIELPLYHLFHKKIYFEFHGSDLRDMEKFCRISDMPFDQSEATSPRLHKRNKKICKYADGIIVHDDELIPYLPTECAPVYVVPLRMNLSRFEPCYPDSDNKIIRIVHAPSKRSIKGTQYVLDAYKTLEKEFDNIELILVEGKTQQEALEIYKNADIIVDQLFVGTYGVFAIESMALGKPVITYISDEMKEKLPEELPIISADSKTIEKALAKLIRDGNLRRQKGIEGRQYVEDYHDNVKIACLLRDVYNGSASPRRGREAFNSIKRPV